MENVITRLDIKDIEIQAVTDFLGINIAKLKNSISFRKNFDEDFFETYSAEEVIKAVTVIKLCDIIGVDCKYNYKSEFFDLFSCVVGQAVVEMLNLKLEIAGANLRFVRYNHVNLIERVKELLNNKENFDEAYLDAFNFVDRFRQFVK